ncbi:MAG: hypothetical protein IT353_07865 [Gemmatimonadaceae bacterium]|nr:hypothetical protein [Gemmatimonadaceae bacterium]
MRQRRTSFSSRRTLCALALLSLTAACGESGGGRAQLIADSTLLAELTQRLAADQAARERLTSLMRSGQAPDSATIHGMMTVDSANTRWLRESVAKDGFPTKARIGEEGMKAVFLLVQHADHDTAFQAWVLPHLEKAYAAGDVRGQDVALLTDRLATARGLPQEYGSQADIENGRVILKPIRDSANVDARRAKMGLPSMKEYLRVLDSVYVGVPAPKGK